MGTGSFGGHIDYLQNVNTTASPATLNGGEIETSWADFLEMVDSKGCALKTRINGGEYTFRIENVDIAACSDYADFFAKFLINSDITVNLSPKNSLKIETELTGDKARLDYFSDMDFFPAEKPYLITGALPAFNVIKTTYSSQTLSIEFFIEVDGTKYEFLILPSDLKAASTWTDIANLLSESPFGKVEYNVTGRLIFTYGTAGKANMSFMQHTPDTQELQTIDGSSLHMGSEFLAYQKYDGADEIRDLLPTAELFKLTESTGATIVQGADNEFNTESVMLLKGTEDYGAHLYPGKDGDVQIINNTAELLKGTAAKGAKLIPATDGGEIPEPYDGIITY